MLASGEAKRRAPGRQIPNTGRLRGAQPLFLFLPLSFEGEGDTGGEVEEIGGDLMTNNKEATLIASDGKPAILLGPWAIEKLYYFKQYCEIFSTGMKNKWGHRIYIDLFSGPGICITRDTGIEHYGSPIISLNCKTPFTHYCFVDENKDFIETLKDRTKDYQYNKTFINEDCNYAIDELLTKLPKTNAIFFTFVDPYNFEIEFDSIKRLAEKRHMDLLITFHIGNLKRSIHRPSQKMTKFFPPLDWERLYRASSGGDRIHERILLSEYEAGLKQLGYKYFDDFILTHNIRNAPLYYLIFATKNERGKEFYSDISMRSRAGQRRWF
jgi:three-Cys-motif partner protein